MTSTALRLSALSAALLLGACVTYPTGPSALALPGTGKSFDQFRADDTDCRQYASSVSGGGSAQQEANNSAAKSAVVGTVIGAAAGAGLGNSGEAAAAGAGAGLLVGALTGSSAGQASAYELQRRYDNGYVQCMYAKGHKVAVPGQFADSPRPARAYPSPQQSYYYPPPPPPSYAPPPPASSSTPPPPGPSYTPPPPPPPAPH